MIRREPTYLSTDTWKACLMLSKSGLMAASTTDIPSPDMVADSLLREIITQKYPQLLEGQKELDKLEKKIIEALRNENKTVSGIISEGAES